MNYRIWYSTESFADYIIAKTDLSTKNFTKKKMYESDANNPAHFHTMPDHIKQILYLDAPDLIVELDSEPIFSIEVSTEAGTGHNVFQRFSRLAASLENNVPTFYIYPEAVIVNRKKGSTTKWDSINPLVFRALDNVINIYKIPALFYYFPSDYRTYPIAASSPNIRNKGLKYESNRNFSGCPDSTDSEMSSMFDAINTIIQVVESAGAIQGREQLLGKRIIINRKNFMQNEYSEKHGNDDMSPLTATTKISTDYILNYLKKYESPDYKIGELLRSRKETIVYKVNAKFRGDPYPGALAAIDYLLCREGKTFEEREYNLIMAWADVRIDNDKKTITLHGKKGKIKDFVEAVESSESKNILTRKYAMLKHSEIARYYMQVRYGSMFSKVKHIRVFSYFADAILFPDGALWRDA
jgi:hypothetical protein